MRLDSDSGHILLGVLLEAECVFARKLEECRAWNMFGLVAA
jgi:hypothetical protein